MAIKIRISVELWVLRVQILTPRPQENVTLWVCLPLFEKSWLWAWLTFSEQQIINYVTFYLEQIVYDWMVRHNQQIDGTPFNVLFLDHFYNPKITSYWFWSNMTKMYSQILQYNVSYGTVYLPAHPISTDFCRGTIGSQFT